MAKDPAILWYYNDYLSGTEHMTFEEQGAYMRLLCKQADIGHMNLDFIKKVLGKSFKKIWPIISEKFLTDDNGCFYQHRVDKEKMKRKNYSETQRDRVKDYWERIKNSDTTVETRNRLASGLELPIKVLPIENRNINGYVFNGDSLKGENVTPYISGIGLLPKMLSVYKLHYPSYPEDETNDYPALLEIAHKIAKYLKIPKDKVLTDHAELIEIRWGDLASFAEQDESWFATKSIQFLNKHFQDFLQKFLKHIPVKNESRSSEIQESVREKYDRIDRESVTGPIR